MPIMILWIPPILCICNRDFVTVYIAYELHKLYPKQTVIELSEQIAGRFAGKIINLYILVFYILATRSYCSRIQRIYH